MEGTARRVAVFIGAGALLAALVGFTVWATSSPGQNNRAGFTAEAAGTTGTSATPTSSSPTTETVTENQTHTRTVRSPASAADNGRNANHGGSDAGRANSDEGRAGAAVPTGYNAAQDPYLPPHAVVAPAPESGQPSRVYRPSNIVPSPARPQAAPQGANPAAEPTPAGAQTSTRTSSQQTPGSTPPREPGEPGESNAAQTSTPATPAPGGSEVQPSEATEPTRTPAQEPSKQPEQPQTTEAPDEASSESEQTPQPGNGSGPSHGPDDMGGTGNTGGAAGIQVGEPSHAQDAPQSPAPKTRLEGAGAAAQPSAGAENTDDADSASASQVTPEAAVAEDPAAPTRVAGKEDVAGYPKEDEGMTARGVLDKITGR